jgi:SAM-dependent methyltransferase
MLARRTEPSISVWSRDQLDSPCPLEVEAVRAPVPSESLQLSQAYWNAAAETYKQAFTGTLVGSMWREAVWRQLDAAFQSGSYVLELNCGTGIDAIHLAHRGVAVLGCDISSRMIELARQNAVGTGVEELLDFRVLATEQLATLQDGTIFDGAFSNFSGLNCVQDLAAVRRSLACRLRPGSRVLLCMLGRFGVWQKLWHLAHGNWNHVFRSAKSTDVEGAIQVQYPSRKQIVALFSPDFKLHRWKGIGIAVPPAYMEHWAVRFPQLTQCLNHIDSLIGSVPMLRNLGGCILLEFERIPLEKRQHADDAQDS